MLPQVLPLALLLLATCTFGQFAVFLQRHVDQPKSQVPGGPTQYCNVLMQRRGLITGNRCKPLNTFIHEDPGALVTLCRTPARRCRNPRMRNCHRSSQPLKVTDCKAVPGTRPPNCRYRSISRSRNIVVACVQQRPVHFDG
ncbi:ribonuclease 4-like [Tachyglossus aculeatus]|uniref:ribonuclease 4-like n=1 Tax=Tachyglossus aculeatus TaxID=9261 RepID=UPI0018F6ECE1|nr:ribonuclease 4-like [Tachyglossus aculeatus]